MAHDDAALRAEMTALVAELAPAEGMTQSLLDGVAFGRSNRSLPRTPVLHDACVVIVCSGRKRGYFGDQVIEYGAQQFMVASVPMPFEGESFATPDDPLLVIKVKLDLAVIADLALAIDPTFEPVPGAESVATAPVDAPLADSVIRLLRALRSPIETKLFGPGLVREVCYRVLTGAKGPALRAALAQRGHFGQIAKALHRIHMDYHQRLDVETLAQEVNLSTASFHAHFKTVTATSPIQYLKATRLHKARLLMIQDGVSASRASSRVGYESASQFSREFKRLFGRTPVEEQRLVHAAYAPAHEGRDRP
ncbi:MAG: AraC family transcriptional regulator N-terminal domain-containing protein [Burkholderiaceae bacterium]|jgi:AraC-like DNA-binding protein